MASSDRLSQIERGHGSDIAAPERCADSRLAWFEKLFGFQEKDGVMQHMALNDSTLQSLANGSRFNVGNFSAPSLAELRVQSAIAWPLEPGPRRLTLRHLPIRDVFELHALPENRNAMFQVASQFNCLEFPNDEVTPEDGVTNYATDGTQGPACALAAAPATVFRNYFLDIGNGQVGQTADSQLNCFADVLDVLDAVDLVDVRNGYAQSDAERLRSVNSRIEGSDRDLWLSKLRIGVHSSVEVPFTQRFTLAEMPSVVSQVFCSAIPVPDRLLDLWTPLATAVLDASYEATLHSAAVQLKSGVGSGVVFLTFLGGETFGNPSSWIEAAIMHACKRLAHVPLDVVLCHHGRVDDRVRLRLDEVYPAVEVPAPSAEAEGSLSAEILEHARQLIAAGKYVPPPLRRAVQTADLLATSSSVTDRD